MSIGRYLCVSFLINTALFYNLYIPARANIIAAEGEHVQTWPMLLMIPLVVAMMTLSGVKPMAEKVPVGSRTSFWSYRKANGATWMMLGIAAIGWATYLLGIH